MHSSEIERWCDLYQVRLQSGEAVAAHEFITAHDLPRNADLVAELERIERGYLSTHVPIGSQRTVVEPVVPTASDGHSPSDVTLGSVGRFVLRNLMGQGSFGRVYCAYDPKLDREVALKLAKFPVAEERSNQRFIGEARAAARLRHPNIVAVYESGQAGDEYYIAAELVKGMSLAQHIAKRRPSIEQSVRWVRDLASALGYAHEEGVIHRDVKPANIIVADDGRPQLADFGLAKRLEPAATITVDGAVLGTPAYMAPEQARGDGRAVGPHSDQYSLGVVLYELLTGQRPFNGPMHVLLAKVGQEEPQAPRRINPQIPRDLEAICLKAMHKNPTGRYSRMRALADDLDRFLVDKPVQARLPGIVERIGRWLSKHRPAVISAGAALATTIVLAFILWYGRPKDEATGISNEAQQAILDDVRKNQARVIVSQQNLRQLGTGIHNWMSVLGHMPPPAIYAADGQPLLSWRVAILPYLSEASLYSKFHLDEPWDSPHNIELLAFMPEVFAAPQDPQGEHHNTYYQVFVGEGALFEENAATPRTQEGVSQADGGQYTVLIAEAKQSVPWTKPEDLAYNSEQSPPKLGGVFPEGFHACLLSGEVQFFRREIYEDEQTLHALIGWNDGELVNLKPYEGFPEPQQSEGANAEPPETTDSSETSTALAEDEVAAILQAAERRRVIATSSRNLATIGLALRDYEDANGALPPPAIVSSTGQPLLSWRVALLPFLEENALYRQFRLHEPWDSPHNHALLEFIPDVYASTVPETATQEDTFYQIFVGPGTPLDTAPGEVRRLSDLERHDGLHDTLLVVEAGQAVPWTMPADLLFDPQMPLPELGGLFPAGFQACAADGYVRSFGNELCDDRQNLQALITWNEGILVDGRRYQQRFDLIPDDELRERGGGATVAVRESAHRVRSLNNLKMLVLAMHRYHDTNGSFPAQAVYGADGQPLLSWRVQLLPYLDGNLLYKQFRLDEPWDSPHNRELLPYMPEVFATPGESEVSGDSTIYQVFTGPGTLFDTANEGGASRDMIPDGATSTLMIVEAGEPVPWTSPVDVLYNANQDVPNLGGVFIEGFHGALADGTVRLFQESLQTDQVALHALIGIDDGMEVDLSAFTR